MPWKKSWTISRPYLNEKIVGDGFEFGKFLIFLVFAGVIGGQAFLMAPMITNLSIFKTKKNTNSVTIGEMAKTQKVEGKEITGGITFDNGNEKKIVTAEPGGTVTVPPSEAGEAKKTTEINITNTPTITPQPKITPSAGLTYGVACEDCKQYKIKGRFTFYWPDKYPSQYKKIEGSNYVRTQNCWEYDLSEKKCISNMASDLPWRSFIGVAVACPLDFPLGTKIEIINHHRTYYCLDRGTMICSGGVCDFDVLAKGISFNAQILEVIITVPNW